MIYNPPMSKVYEYCRLMRLDKPVGIFLLLWPTWWALWIAAGGLPPLKILIVFTAGVIIMRTAGDIINDIADRHIDGAVSRTKQRPLATGSIKTRQALYLFLLLCALAGCLLLFLNRLAFLLALIGLILACLYPFMKRFTHWPQAFLGLAYSWGVLMAFAAVRNELPWLAWWLFATAVIWVIAYDSFYAMTDREDDLKIGVKSTAILFGRYDNFIIACLQALVLISWIVLAQYLHLEKIFYLGWCAALFLGIYQQYLVRHRHPQACLKAFRNNHWFGLALFAGLLMGLT
jgi:4-hydroxybenzoate polyprenyltransferase